MLTGVFRNRVRARTEATQSPDDVLALLLRSKKLRPHRFVRHCEIGPFVVAHVCAQRALVIDLSRDPRATESRNSFLESLGYRILRVSRREVMTRPESVIARVCSALQ